MVQVDSLGHSLILPVQPWCCKILNDNSALRTDDMKLAKKKPEIGACDSVACFLVDVKKKQLDLCMEIRAKKDGDRQIVRSGENERRSRMSGKATEGIK